MSFDIAGRSIVSIAASHLKPFLEEAFVDYTVILKEI